jgi:hypothetical protein
MEVIRKLMVRPTFAVVEESAGASGSTREEPGIWTMAGGDAEPYNH